MGKSPRQILILAGVLDSRSLRAVQLYAQEHRWELTILVTEQQAIPRAWKGDGILCWLSLDQMAQFVVKAGVPAVDFGIVYPKLKVAHVVPDNARIVQLVIEHFLVRGYRNFAFYDGCTDRHHERGRAFLRALQHFGHNCTWLRWNSPLINPLGPHAKYGPLIKWLAEALDRLPKPLAIFAASDLFAPDVLAACEKAGLKVPSEVAIAGTGNFRLAGDAMPIPITTVDIDIEGIWYRGAALLDGLINGKAMPQRPIRWAPKGLIVRKSTDFCAADHEGVAKAVKFMWKHYQEPIHVKDLAAAGAMSVRALHRAFQDNLGRHPGQVLRQYRIEKAKDLLMASTNKIEIVAADCGFRDIYNFWVSFRKMTGMTPKEYRMSFMRRQNPASS